MATLESSKCCIRWKAYKGIPEVSNYHSAPTYVYKYAVFFAVCQEKDQYGNLQNYVVDTDPTTSMKLSAYSNYEDSEIDHPETGLRILKYETGTEIPISGALFEVIGPDGDSIGTFATNGDGRIEIPLSKVGNYTVIERQAPPIISSAKSQHRMSLSSTMK